MTKLEKLKATMDAAQAAKLEGLEAAYWTANAAYWAANAAYWAGDATVAAPVAAKAAANHAYTAYKAEMKRQRENSND
jgi:hypothetical protein